MSNWRKKDEKDGEDKRNNNGGNNPSGNGNDQKTGTGKKKRSRGRRGNVNGNGNKKPPGNGKSNENGNGQGTGNRNKGNANGNNNGGNEKKTFQFDQSPNKSSTNVTNDKGRKKSNGKGIPPLSLSEKEWKFFENKDLVKKKNDKKNDKGKNVKKYDRTEYQQMMGRDLRKFGDVMNKVVFTVSDMPLFVNGCQKLLDDDAKNFVDLLMVVEKGRKPIDNLLKMLDVDLVVTKVEYDYHISFQLFVVPLLTIITDNRIPNESMRVLMNELFAIDGLLHFTFLDCLSSLDLNNLLGDSTARLRPHPVNTPKSYIDIFLPVLKVYMNLMQFNRNFLSSDEITNSIVQIILLVDHWMDYDKKEYDHKDSIQDLVNRLKIKLKYQAPIKESIVTLDIKSTKIKAVPHLNVPLESLDFPGELSMFVPRHDNDKISIKDIKILPTFCEILSPRESYIPMNNLSAPHHIEYVNEKYLDIMFRLLRENVIGPLKQSFIEIFLHLMKGNDLSGRMKFQDSGFKREREIDIQSVKELENILNYDFGSSLKEKPLYVKKTNGADLQVYTHLQILPPLLNKNRSFGIGLSVYSSNIENYKKAEKEKFWEQTNQLQHGSLVGIFFEDSMSLYFGTVIDKKPNRTVNCIVYISFETEDIGNITKGLYQDQRCILFESTGIYFESYKPILENLKKMEPLSLPFYEVLLEEYPIRTLPNFLDETKRVDLTPVFNKRIPTSRLIRSPTIAELSNGIPYHTISKYTTLDNDQWKSIEACLTSSVGLIQGPPGTGKTFLGAKIVETILLNNFSTKPIVVICYTNHALDSFLSDLIDCGIKEIVRFGSRSKMDKMNEYTPRRWAEKFKGNGSGFHARRREFKAYERIDTLLQSVQKKSTIVHHLETENFNLRTFRSHLCACDQEFFNFFDTMKNLDKDEDPIIYWLENNSPKEPKKKAKSNRFSELVDEDGNEIELSKTKHKKSTLDSKWKFSLSKRRMICQNWKLELLEQIYPLYLQEVREFNQSIKDLEEARSEKDLETMRQMKIVAFTTTGLAKREILVNALQPDIIICEEAAEVLEAHIISSIQNSKQLLLIGDHLQLRPKIENYKLSMENPRHEFNLNLSLFERLVQGNYPISTLSQQRRMRPLISSVIREVFYNDLADFESVLEYPHVFGVQEDMLFIHHTNPENGKSLGRSYSNSYEATLITQFVLYLLNSYNSDQIVILTTYLGQLFEIKKQLRKDNVLQVEISEQDLRDAAEAGMDIDELDNNIIQKNLGQIIRVSTVDNFQGEESDIILLSTVRNNPKNIGFLKIENRINVMLSRARIGMFVFGNQNLLADQSDTWRRILGIYERENLIKDHIPLFCIKHEDRSAKISKPSDFKRFSPNGGCLLPCEDRLDCGHQCRLSCHPNDHSTVRCMEDCPIPRDCGHLCKRRCYENCGPCHERVKLTEYQLSCGHMFTGITACHIMENGTIRCPTPCGEAKECGHECVIPCSENHQTDSHSPEICIQACGIVLSCGHKCTKQCHYGEECGDCDMKCLVKCEHSQCVKLCGVYHICSPCIEPCQSECAHQGLCRSLCGAPCSRSPCNVRCEKLLECGHQCMSVCSEKCNSKLCIVCSPDLGEEVVDFINFKPLSDINLDEDPVIMLNCEHIISISNLDGIFQLDQYYQKDGDNYYPKNLLLADLREEFPNCPYCREPILELKRYKRIYNKIFLDNLDRNYLQENKQFIQAINQELELENPNLKSLLKQINSQINAGQPTEKLYQKMRKNDSHHGLISDIYRTPKVDIYWLKIKVVLKLLEGKTSSQTMSGEVTKLNKIFQNLHNNVIDPQKDERRYIENLYFWIKVLLTSIRIHFDLFNDKDYCFSLLDQCQANLDLMIIIPNSLLETIDKADIQTKIDGMRQYITTGVRYVGITEEELKNVFNSFNESIGYGGQSGHWYRCPNGHLYVIGECGRAMQLGNCPECGEQVGGQSHNSVANNQVDNDFVNQMNQRGSNRF